MLKSRARMPSNIKLCEEFSPDRLQKFSDGKYCRWENSKDFERGFWEVIQKIYV